MTKLSESLPFGHLAAEEEEGWLEHVYLSDIDDKRHERALVPHNRIILGLRGAGKTALARFLKFQKIQPFDTYVSVDQRTALSRIHADVEELLSRSRAPFQEDIIRLWTLAFWTAVMSELQETRKLNSVAVRKYLAAAQPKGPLDRSQILLDGLAAQLRGEGTTLLDWDRLRGLLEVCEFEHAQEDTRKALNHTRIALVIDSLEDLPLGSKSMESVATALLTAASRPNLVHENVQVKCMVPTEFWRIVADKITGLGKLAPFEMRWTTDDLVRLVCKRYTNYLAEKEGANAPVLPSTITWTSIIDVKNKSWGRFFPKRAAGRSGFSEDVEVLLMRHTQLRPRQLISLCNDIASRSHLSRFNPDHVRAAIREKVDDLAQAVFAAFNDIYPDAEAILQKALRGMPAVFDSNSISADKEFWRVGYEMGVVGPVVGNTPRPFDSSEFAAYRIASFSFCQTGPANWLPQHESVAVHPMFHKRFAITETADTMVGLDAA